MTLLLTLPLMLASLEVLLQLPLPSLLALAVVPSVLLPLGPLLALLPPLALVPLLQLPLEPLLEALLLPLALVPLVPVPLYPLLVPNSSFS